MASLGLDIYVREMERYYKWARDNFPTHAHLTLKLWQELSTDPRAHACYKAICKKLGVS